MAKELSRRTFLKIGAATFAAASLPGCRLWDRVAGGGDPLDPRFGYGKSATIVPSQCGMAVIASGKGHWLAAYEAWDPTTGTTTVKARTITWDPQGDACTQNTDCLSGFCVDGFCCDAACGGGDPTDCQACNVPGHEGTCSPVAAGTVVCRAATGLCDAPEACDGSSTICPADQRAPAGTVCRASAGACDVAETCDGTNAACPADGLRNSGYICRAAADVCDVDETCTGSSAACPADAMRPSDYQCRPPTDLCETPAFCTGSAPTCPANPLRHEGYVCRAAAGPCDAAETCTGRDWACPDDVLRPSSYQCRPPTDLCEAPALCTGATVDCPANPLRPAGYECRAAAGPCDVAETCTGTDWACPDDTFIPNGTSCDDGNACTQNDTCQAGTCAGANPVVCSASDQCHVAGTCNPADGQCSNPPAPNGAACDDGLFCNGPDACFTGACASHAGDPCPSDKFCVEFTRSCERSTNIELVSFTATGGQGQVALAWVTATETDNAGFRLWRADSEAGTYARITADPIPSQGDPTHGATYSFTDSNLSAGKTYWYKLEDVDIHGQSTFHGPVNATVLRKPLFGCGG